MSASKNNKNRLVVIGAGPGGYPAAFRAAQLGFEVTLVDPRKAPGGVCLYEGCIPSKALLRLARTIQETRDAEAWGIHFDQPRIDVDQLRKRLRKAVRQLTGGLGSLCKQRGVRFVRAKGRFLDENRIGLSGKDDEPDELEFDRAIIATGSSPAELPGFDDSHSAIWNSTEALELKSIPDSLLVVGAGYIGLEMGTIYSALGSKVTVVEMTGSILPGVDPELGKVLHARLAGKESGIFEDILLESGVAGMKPNQTGVSVELEDPAGKTRRQSFNKVLVAVGRRPNTADLDLEQAGLEVNANGFIEVDEQCRTRQKHIFAIGDVCGEPMLAHRASHQGKVAAEAAAKKAVAFEHPAIPAVVFTDPEIAWVGLSEAEAHDLNLNVEVARFPWQASGRAIASGRPEGLTKLLFEKRSERLLGAGIVGLEAGELVAEAALAIEMGACATDLAETIHPHPTFSETLMECAHTYLGQSAHYKPGQ